MKKFFLFATTLILMTGISKAAKNEAATVVNASTIDNNAAAPAVSAAASMAEIIKENQNLKQALLKAAAENESLSGQVNYNRSMYFATTALYEVELAKQNEKAKDQADYAWMMHNVLTTLTAITKSI